MEGGDQSEAVQQFCAVTAATPDQAKFFLESCAWQLEPAIHSFFENDSGAAPAQSFEERAGDGSDEDDEYEEEAPASRRPKTSTSSATSEPQEPGPVQNRYATRSSGPVQGAGGYGSGGGGTGSSRAKSGKDKAAARSSSGRGGITTLSDLNKQPDSDSDSDGPNEYYTGGEKSGMMVQDPTSKNNRDVDSIFDRARQVGAREVIDMPSATNSRGIFSGQGRTVSGAQAVQTPTEPGPPQPVFHTITFWRNGFTVDDGPLRRLDDPANSSFLSSINKTECPRELEPADRNTPVHVNLVKKDEDFQPPPEPKYVAFQGTGRTLGGSSSQSSETTAIPFIGEAPSQPSAGLVVDDQKPVTSIQLRLQDGTRLVARFNHSHTVADIRGFIDAARPGNSGPYVLQSMGFPPKQLLDPTQTIQQAGLINAVVIQR